MEGLFEEYTWLILAIVGGFLGMALFFGLLFGAGSPMGQAVADFMGGLM